MIQEFLTFTAIALASGYFIYSLYRTFIPQKGKVKKYTCSGCNGGCGITK